MGFSSCTLVAVLILLPCLFTDLGAAIHYLTSSQFIKDLEALISPGNMFKLGFFSPANATNRYVGIWYNQISVISPIWITNRNKPLSDSSGIFKVSEEGNLVVLNGQRNILWSSNVSNGADNSSAQLNDDGNLVLLDIINGNSTIWESFQHPCDTFVKEMSATADQKTREKRKISSGNGPSDPSSGNFSTGFEPQEIPQVFIWNRNRPYWRSGPWNGRIFIGIPITNSNYFSGFTLARDGNGIFYMSYSYADKSLSYDFVLNYKGE